MNIPMSYTVKHHIGSFLYRNPNSTFDEIKSGMLGRRASFIKSLVDAMTEDGLLINTSDTYAICAKFRDYFDALEASKPEDVPVVPPRTIPEFRPLSSKNMAHLALRREPIREVSFMNGSIGFSAGYRL